MLFQVNDKRSAEDFLREAARWRTFDAMQSRAGHVLYHAELCAAYGDRNGERRYSRLARKMVRVAFRWRKTILGGAS